MKVVYGHTDSIYVQIDSVEKAQVAQGQKKIYQKNVPYLHPLI